MNRWKKAGFLLISAALLLCASCKPKHTGVGGGPVSSVVSAGGAAVSSAPGTAGSSQSGANGAVPSNTDQRPNGSRPSFAGNGAEQGADELDVGEKNKPDTTVDLETGSVTGPPAAGAASSAENSPSGENGTAHRPAASSSRPAGGASGSNGAASRNRPGSQNASAASGGAPQTGGSQSGSSKPGGAQNESSRFASGSTETASRGGGADTLSGFEPWQ